MNITVIGHVCIDTNVTEATTNSGAGSPAVFMDKVYKNFPDVSVSIIAPYGKDFLPYTKNLNIYPAKPLTDETLHYENYSKGNVNHQKAYGLKNAVDVKIDEHIEKVLAHTDILFFAPLLPVGPSYVKKIIDCTTTKTLKILVPQGFLRDFDDEDNVIQRKFKEEEEILSLFDMVIVSIADHENMKSLVKKWSGKVQVIMTLGDEGSVYMHKEKQVYAPVEKVALKDIVDSVGSGDIFSASFGYKYSQTKNAADSLSFANNIARQCLFCSADNLKIVFPE